jgi:hypothetical protein
MQVGAQVFPLLTLGKLHKKQFPAPPPKHVWQAGLQALQTVKLDELVVPK